MSVHTSLVRPLASTTDNGSPPALTSLPRSQKYSLGFLSPCLPKRNKYDRLTENTNGTHFFPALGKSQLQRTDGIGWQKKRTLFEEQLCRAPVGRLVQLGVQGLDRHGPRGEAAFSKIGSSEEGHPSVPLVTWKRGGDQSLWQWVAVEVCQCLPRPRRLTMT